MHQLKTHFTLKSEVWKRISQLQFTDPSYPISTWVTRFLSSVLGCHSLWYHPVYLHKLQSTCLNPDLIDVPQPDESYNSGSTFFCWPGLCKRVTNWQPILLQFPTIWFLVPQTQQGVAQSHFSQFRSCKLVGTFFVARIPWSLMVAGNPPIPPHTQITLQCFFKDHSGHTPQPPPDKMKTCRLITSCMGLALEKKDLSMWASYMESRLNYLPCSTHPALRAIRRLSYVHI